jgi:hypothetical protein
MDERFKGVINKKLIVARDVTQAMELIRKNYPLAKLITFKMEKNFQNLPQIERDYNNRKMWVWFIEDTDEIKELI